MLIIVQQGGIAPGGNNFDCKLRRESTDIEDMFIAHIGGPNTSCTPPLCLQNSCLKGLILMFLHLRLGMDCLARGLLGACKLLQENLLQKALDTRPPAQGRPLRQKHALP